MRCHGLLIGSLAVDHETILQYRRLWPRPEQARGILREFVGGQIVLHP